MAETSKRMKRLIHEYAAAAHEAELRRALLPLADAFKQWEQDELDSYALQDLIHKFHRELHAICTSVTQATALSPRWLML